MFAWFKQLNKTLYQLKIEPDIPYQTDEIAEPQPDMNIKVAAYTVTQNLYNNDFLTILSKKCSVSLWD